jgi:hypothetical protein
MVTPQTPENSARDARDEIILTIPPEHRTRGRKAQAEPIQAPVVEFPSLSDGKKVTNQVIGGLIDSLRTIIS